MKQFYSIITGLLYHILSILFLVFLFEWLMNYPSVERKAIFLGIAVFMMLGERIVDNLSDIKNLLASNGEKKFEKRNVRRSDASRIITTRGATVHARNETK